MVNFAGRLSNRGAQVIPDGWEERHRPIPDAAATATIELWSGADPEWVWDPVTQAEVRDHGTLLWTGRARVQQRHDTDTEPAGTQQVTTHRYLVAMPREAGTGEWVRVVSSGDPLLGWLKVIDTLKGSLRWERDLICTDHLDGGAT